MFVILLCLLTMASFRPFPSGPLPAFLYSTTETVSRYSTIYGTISFVKFISTVVSTLFADTSRCGSIPHNSWRDFVKWTQVKKLKTTAWIWCTGVASNSPLRRECLSGLLSLSFVLLPRTFYHPQTWTLTSETSLRQFFSLLPANEGILEH